MMDAIQGRISVPQKARGFLKHDLLQNFMKQVLLATFTGEESEALGRFRVPCPGHTVSEWQSWYWSQVSLLCLQEEKE